MQNNTQLSTNLKRIIHQHSERVLHLSDYTMEQMEKRLHDDVIELIKKERGKNARRK